ncbi:uncharacterized protein [Nicotiana tomentosiformis]|uniref:uncharacterized protein n=1 Tax=Nicotiana tomentosiformis TaxID=4098 RepID=UPI00388CBF20
MHRHSTLYLPKANEAVKVVNKNIKKILRKMIQGSRQWHEKLPFALIGYCMTAHTFVGATPYLLIYGMEAVIPAEVEIPSLRIIMESEIEDTEWVKTRLEQLMLIDEKPASSSVLWQVIPAKNGTCLQQESASKALRDSSDSGSKFLETKERSEGDEAEDQTGESIGPSAEPPTLPGNTDTSLPPDSGGAAV